ncbi:hypothetical protein [Aliiglaciecola sp. M165]|uniref:hypothetical protein n=1 Tax=Aliiglaciecola sp. M165 TaxID=2593649 RepID=UPI00117E8818|nr:hypothetical protein [Aliiglaciecola sp. M165]TRY31413.1 hypothetical protein FM019_11095 [Aliiglaciecola sp. M165]
MKKIFLICFTVVIVNVCASLFLHVKLNRQYEFFNEAQSKSLQIYLKEINEVKLKINEVNTAYSSPEEKTSPEKKTPLLTPIDTLDGNLDRRHDESGLDIADTNIISMEEEFGNYQSELNQSDYNNAFQEILYQNYRNNFLEHAPNSEVDAKFRCTDIVCEIVISSYDYKQIDLLSDWLVMGKALVGLQFSECIIERSEESSLLIFTNICVIGSSN